MSLPPAPQPTPKTNKEKTECSQDICCVSSPTSFHSDINDKWPKRAPYLSLMLIPAVELPPAPALALAPVPTLALGPSGPGQPICTQAHFILDTILKTNKRSVWVRNQIQRKFGLSGSTRRENGASRTNFEKTKLSGWTGLAFASLLLEIAIPHFSNFWGSLGGSMNLLIWEVVHEGTSRLVWG